MDTNALNNIVLTKLESLGEGQARIEGVISQMNKRFESIDNRFESIDKRFESMESMQRDLRQDFRSLSNRIDSGLTENRSEIQNSRRFSFTLFCFALGFSAISMAGLIGKMFGLY